MLTYVVSIPVVIVSAISLVMRSSDLRGNDVLSGCLECGRRGRGSNVLAPACAASV